MPTFKKKTLKELVGGDIFADGNDRNVVSNSEIETGPVDKPFNDDSEYEKGQATTTDKVFGRYRQNIPWFAVYSFGGTRAGGSVTVNIPEGKNTIIKKKHVEEKIEDLVKKNKNNYEVTDKNYNKKVADLIDTIDDVDLTDAQLEELTKAIMAKKNNTNKTKNL
jgi:hypothetical protein